jgi:hypothetical protein
LLNGGTGQEVAGTVVGPQQDLDPSPELRVTATRLRQVGRSPVDVGDLEGGTEDVLLRHGQLGLQVD